MHINIHMCICTCCVWEHTNWGHKPAWKLRILRGSINKIRMGFQQVRRCLSKGHSHWNWSPQNGTQNTYNNKQQPNTHTEKPGRLDVLGVPVNMFILHINIFMHAPQVKVCRSCVFFRVCCLCRLHVMNVRRGWGRAELQLNQTHTCTQTHTHTETRNSRGIFSQHSHLRRSRKMFAVGKCLRRVDVDRQLPYYLQTLCL